MFLLNNVIKKFLHKVLNSKESAMEIIRFRKFYNLLNCKLCSIYIFYMLHKQATMKKATLLNDKEEFDQPAIKN